MGFVASLDGEVRKGLPEEVIAEQMKRGSQEIIVKATPTMPHTTALHSPSHTDA